MSETSMTPEQREQVAELIGGAKPTAASLVISLAEAVSDVREHEHPKWEDLHCQNLLMWLGERMGPVLRRLLDAESKLAHYRPAFEAQRSRAETLDRLLRTAQARVTELEAAQGTVYRAEHPDSGIVLGHYGTEAAARAHCEAMTRREFPTSNVDWIEDDEDRVAELTVWVRGEELTTGYVVTALELGSEYDPDGDE